MRSKQERKGGPKKDPIMTKIENKVGPHTRTRTKPGISDTNGVNAPKILTGGRTNTAYGTGLSPDAEDMPSARYLVVPFFPDYQTSPQSTLEVETSTTQ